MRRKIYYCNKGWARKAMTTLVHNRVMFETMERPKEGGEFGEYELGVKFYLAGDGWVTYWPTDKRDLSEIRLRTH